MVHTFDVLVAGAGPPGPPGIPQAQALRRPAHLEDRAGAGAGLWPRRAGGRGGFRDAALRDPALGPGPGRRSRAPALPAG